ncbi:hypothetical protein KOR42_48430 [Thalassoglobus neptunius]|uniref:Uncharacterized protein n=1 Tax=Thalassoglobus neptunius TaxID=1938619 RepID=A0A5C5VT86_9PLAN|nr:helix-turn-helix domain-containing protein [Thalassoglobus neptunius]TWT41303.1 hypothetical protein KOR42_48430 [Thalassoglobus neptunius]
MSKGSYSCPKAPRIGHYANHNLVELGAYELIKLRQSSSLVFHPWNPIPERKQTVKPKKKRDRMRLARYYQTLLDSGKFESRAALARYLGVSRARVTQVLNRLKDQDATDTKSA